VESKEVLEIRNKNATRPFQHVLDCLFGYLLVAQTHISQTNLQIFDSYNFGPEKSLSVSETIGKFTKIIGDFLQIAEQESEVREHIQLHLDSTKAKIELNWLPSYSTDESVSLAASWYIKYLQGKQARDLMLHDLLGCRGFRDAM
jgi:CDP-glucose 4,6-dehydratase